MKKMAILFFLFLVLLSSAWVHAEDCAGIKIVSWKATSPVYTGAAVKISNTSGITKFVYIVGKHNDGQWYKIIGEKIKVDANRVVEQEIKTGGTWTSIIDVRISRCE